MNEVEVLKEVKVWKFQNDIESRLVGVFSSETKLLEVLKNIPKTQVLQNGKEVKINELFCNAVTKAEKEFSNTNSEYPSFGLIDL